jgi:hypothetical protein
LLPPLCWPQDAPAETTRIMGVAFELARIILRLKVETRRKRSSPEGLSSWPKPASAILTFYASASCVEFGKPALVKGGRASRNEYHLIDLGRGLSCGGFNSLAAARQCARKENMVA